MKSLRNMRLKRKRLRETETQGIDSEVQRLGMSLRDRQAQVGSDLNIETQENKFDIETQK